MSDRVGLADNVDLSEATFRRADGFRQRLRHAVDRREATIAAGTLDRDFCLPQANWDPENGTNDFFLAYRHLRDGGFDAVNRLRLWSPCFTGYNLKTLSFAPGAPSVAPLPADFDRWVFEQAAEPDRWVRRWLRAVRGIPRRYRFSPPPMLGEIGWKVGGVIVNHDTHAYQERLNLLYYAGIFERLRGLGRPARILEIGGGYGALAMAFRRIFPDSAYVICDLPEALMFSGLYLLATTEEPALVEPDAPFDAGALARPGTVLVPNYLFHLLEAAGAGFDLVINTLSMSEMSPHQITTYSAAISRMIGESGVFFEQNVDDRHRGLTNAKLHVKPHFSASLPIRVPAKQRRHGPAHLWANADIGRLLPGGALRRWRQWILWSAPALP